MIQYGQVPMHGQAPMAIQQPNVQYMVKIVTTCIKYLAVSEVSRGPHTNLYAKGPRYIRSIQ